MTNSTSSEYTSAIKRKAAYALNLCTVSVSQIIDYNDLMILENEYDTILNNLNLEHFPKDASLLSTLKKLLDTITFFRIQAGDRQLMEKEYQHKVKNAIWSAIPNLGLLVSGGNLVTTALSIASQVGIGYMNYRKVKAENELEHEKQEWQLMRSAIEQFNGLRRELFDTAWRLAEEYQFPDEYRLTERQIEQFNKILMDPDDLRRFERLDAIKSKFIAYPPFWYYIGNASNLLAQQFHSSDINLYQEFDILAKEYFDKFITESQERFFREDQLVASCALEYIELLDSNNDKLKIAELINMAIEASGNSLDVIELCAISYLKIGYSVDAAILLYRLVNEDYNTIVNAQLLSFIYSTLYLKSSNTEKISIINKYHILENRVNQSEYLFPLPQIGASSITTCEEAFLRNQRMILKDMYRQVLSELYGKYIIKFNRILPITYDNQEFSDTLFIDEPLEYRDMRLSSIKKVLQSESTKSMYISRLQDANLTTKIINLLNDLMDSFNKLGCIDIETEEMISTLILAKIIEVRDGITALQKKITERTIKSEDADELFGYFDLRKYISNGMNEATGCVDKYVNDLLSMEEISYSQSTIREFCKLEGLDEPTQKIDVQSTNAVLQKRKYFSSHHFGKEAVKEEKKSIRISTLIQEIERSRTKIITNSNVVNLYIKNEQEFNAYTRKYLKSEENSDMLAIVDDTHKDALFRRNDIIIYSRGVRIQRNKSIVKFSNISKSIGNKIQIGNDIYENKDLNIDAFCELMNKLAEFDELKTEMPVVSISPVYSKVLALALKL